MKNSTSTNLSYPFYTVKISNDLGESFEEFKERNLIKARAKAFAVLVFEEAKGNKVEVFLNSGNEGSKPINLTLPKESEEFKNNLHEEMILLDNYGFNDWTDFDEILETRLEQISKGKLPSNQVLLEGIKQMEKGLKKVQNQISKLDDPWFDDYSTILQKRLETLKTAIEVEIIEAV